MTPIAEIVGGSLRWHIPNDSYAVPVEYLRGVHMLYAAARMNEEYDPLTDEPMDVASMSAVVGKYEDALKAMSARIAELEVMLGQARNALFHAGRATTNIGVLSNCESVAAAIDAALSPPTKEQA